LGNVYIIVKKTKAQKRGQMKKNHFILWFNQISIKDIAKVGGKNASLGEMYRELSKQGIKVPNGFAITAQAYKYFIKSAGIEKQIKKYLKGLDRKNIKQLKKSGRKIRQLIEQSKYPEDLKKAIIKDYQELSKKYKEKTTDTAVRSSATAEDLPGASFAGQQETYLNIKGEKDLLKAIKKCFASLYTDRAIVYREEKGFKHTKVYLSVAVQKMTRSDRACSGVMFTIDTETGFKNTVFINAAWGLGENIVQGKLNPDEYHVFKPMLKKAYTPITAKKLGSKKIKMIYSKGKKPVKNIKTTEKEQNKYCLSDKEILQLAKWGMQIEEHYDKPMDIEWAKDGKTNQLMILQARPETVQSQKDTNIIEDYYLKKKGKIIAAGTSVGSKIGQGKAKIIQKVKDIHQFKQGEVLVTDMTDPDWVPIMRIASAIVTNKGGRTCHAAIVSRELGIPCIVGTSNATEKIKNKQEITVSCAEGEEGHIYKGKLPFGIHKIKIKEIPKTKTKIMMNIGNPDEAFEKCQIPNKGVGLAREEFIITSYIKIHPRALIEYEKQDKKTKKKINKITKAYKDKKQFFTDQLARGIGTIGAAFWPNDVIVRLSDFKTNEYANLIGGKQYEPKENNPMIGWRGASRYYSKEYKQAFALECKAIKKAREEFGLKNIKTMIPFCRTVEEGKKAIQEMKQNGLAQGKKELQVYVMCEIPSNAILTDEFSKVFDGFSIGTNDLTQLTLGLDRDSALVSSLYNERNQAVKMLVEYAIRRAKAKGKKIGLCGDAPSTYEDFAEFLVKCGIDSISLSPDAVVKTTLAVAKMEKKLR